MARHGHVNMLQVDIATFLVGMAFPVMSTLSLCYNTFVVILSSLRW